MIEELDLLKKDWKKNENSFNQVSENEIYSMIHKKSSSIVKWILIISILELIAWSSLSFVFNSDNYLKKHNFGNILKYLNYVDYIHYVIIAGFIILFYKNYKSISVITSTKKLMTDIIKTRKTVQYYIWYNLSLLTLSFVAGIFLAIYNNPAFENNKNINFKIGFIIGFIVVSVLFVAFLWLIYRLLYGRLLKKLMNNYKELKKIEL